MKAPELLQLAMIYLARRYPDAVLVPELSIGNWGKALLDVAAVTANEIIGVEIKGDGDSAARMPLQAAVYSKAATRMFILPAPSLEKTCFRHAPDCWGRLRIEDGKVVRALRHAWHKDEEPEVLCTAPRQLLQALWKEELRYIARRHEIFTTRDAYAHTLLDRLSEDLPVKVLRAEVCAAIRERANAPGKWQGKPFVWAKFVNAREDSWAALQSGAAA
jgi:hypothetical protein